MKPELKTAAPLDSKNFSFLFIAKDLLWSAILVTQNSKYKYNFLQPVYNYNIGMFLVHKLMYSFVNTVYKRNMDQQLKSFSLCKLSRPATYRINCFYKILICKQVRSLNYFRTFFPKNMSETIDTPMDTSDQDRITDDDMVQQLEQRGKDFADFIEAETQRLRGGSKVIEKGGEAENITRCVVAGGGSGTTEPVNCDNLYYKNFTPTAARLVDGNGDIEIEIPPLSISPYLRISKYLNESVQMKKKRVWIQPPRVSTPATPSSAPKLCLVATEGGGMAVKKMIAKTNVFEPEFFGDDRSGYAIGVTDFKCSDSYTATFDLMRRCRICAIEHDVFPQEQIGTLFIGDAYAPCIIGENGRCLPVFRLHNASFTEVAYKLRTLLKSRKGNDGKFLGTPRLIIISLPSYLKSVGAAIYLHDFNKFRCWAEHFLSSREDISPADSRVVKPCSTLIRVCEGFSLFIKGDTGIAESTAVIARSMEILTAFEPSQTPGFFHPAMAETMSEFCTDPPPQPELTGYVAIEPVPRDFVVYESRTRFSGLPVNNLVDGCFKPEITLFFTKKLVSLVHAWYLKNGLENFTDTLPRIDEIVRIEQPDTDRIEAFKNLPFHESNDERPRVFIIGNSNLGVMNRALESTLDEETVYVKYTFNIFATDLEIKTFFDNLKLGKSDIVVLGGNGNSLIQGMLTPRYKRHEPSGAPAGHAQTGFGKSKVFHALSTAPYDPEYFDFFGIHVDKMMSVIKPTGAKVIYLTPFPRYMKSCCNESGHFHANYSGTAFNAEVIRLGVFLSRLPSLKGSFVLAPEDFCDRNEWVSRGSMLCDDYVHLTPKGINSVRDLVQRCIQFIRQVPEVPIPSLGSRVPVGLRFSKWVGEFRAVCGYDDLRSTSSAKRHLPAHKLQRPAKR